ncbi:hypothetical protein [uncultured Aquimarina sp.]|uniref:hypothetical protein n=1 Tax=uncultured Aquimarina sp. TaxID=575652 RepID=UPI0026072BE7|nr:hypothetical protein [uncultured Aquimarina sp.]
MVDEDYTTIFKKNNFYKKYILSWLLPLIFFFVYRATGQFFVLLILFYVIFLGVCYSRLNHIKLDSENLFYGKKKIIPLSEIQNLYIIDQKAWVFYVFKTSSSNLLNKYLFTEAKKIGLGTLLNWKSSKMNSEKFIEILETKTNIPSKRIDELF